ncbi:hypothetical protein I6F36_05795 [Bradyrhizobium sp. BRP19]|uniref:hypothetical protein n=1 Tax=Bradyrhizobium sp. BRP19 TaxID=2793823 RepID=UPI001CD460AA|nr:hypothetical protein [Bradyrhizobium sp. BRP19]MCA1546316.1 hypothetical protein [Bradyrhizobium sp. BRP19]
MQLKKESPAGGRGNPEAVLAGASNVLDHIADLREIQAARLARRCPITFAMALTIAPLLHGESADA